MNSASHKAARFNLRLLIAGGAVLLFHLLGWLSPDQFWATNYLAFMPQGWALLIICGAGALVLVAGFNLHKGIKLRFPELGTGGKLILLSVGLGLMFGLMCYAVPIVDDNYGNAGTYREMKDVVMPHLPEGGWTELFALDLSPGQGRRMVYQFCSLLSYSLKISLADAFRLLGAVSGGLFAGMWFWFVSSYFKDSAIKWTMLLAGLSAPMVQLFFGHLESYAPVLLVLTGWLILLMLYFRDGKRLQLWGLLPLLLLGLRLNALFLLLIPLFGLTLLHGYFSEKKAVQKLFTVRGMLLGGFVPMGILGLLAYFLVFEDYNDPRALDEFRDIDRLFLPIISPEAPLDRYNLFSPAHLFDFLSVLLSASPVLLLLMVSGISSIRGAMKKPETIAVIFAVLLLGAMLFMMNPLFSMPMDWDLFCILSPPLLILLGLLLRHAAPHQLVQQALPACLGLSLLVIPMLSVNHSRQSHSERLISVAKYAYGNYYLHSDKNILYALIAAQPDPDTYLLREKEILDALAPQSLPGNDPKYANLWLDYAINLYHGKQDLPAAKAAFLESAQYAPLSPQYSLQLMEIHFRLDEFAQAHILGQEILRLKYPNEITALRIVMSTALETANYQQALVYSERMLEIDPKDAIARQIKTRIQNDDSVSQLKFLFKRK